MSPEPTQQADPGATEFAGRARWLLAEIGGYVLGDDASEVERDDAARRTLRNGHGAFQSFVDSRVACVDTVVVELMIRRDDDAVRRAFHRELPGPIALLYLCLVNCEPGDHVLLRQTTACGSSVTCEEQWPFDLACAERMTLPAGAQFRRGDRDGSDGDV
jgi:hypothetical protein